MWQCFITTVTTKGNIDVRSINTSATTGNAGNVQMHSARNVQVEKIYATSVSGAGGSVLIQAGHNVNAEAIDVSSQSGTPGTVTVDAGGKAHFKAIGFVYAAGQVQRGLESASLDSADIWQAGPTSVGIANDGTIGVDYGSLLVVGKRNCTIEHQTAQ